MTGWITFISGCLIGALIVLLGSDLIYLVAQLFGLQTLLLTYQAQISWIVFTAFFVALWFTAEGIWFWIKRRIWPEPDAAAKPRRRLQFLGGLWLTYVLVLLGFVFLPSLLAELKEIT